MNTVLTLTGKDPIKPDQELQRFEVVLGDDGWYYSDYYIRGKKINPKPDIYSSLASAQFAGQEFILIYGYGLANIIVLKKEERIPSHSELLFNWEKIIANADK